MRVKIVAASKGIVKLAKFPVFFRIKLRDSKAVFLTYAENVIVFPISSDVG